MSRANELRARCWAARARDATALVCLLAQSAAVFAQDADTAPRSAASVLRLSIEELAEIEVSIVSKRPQRLRDAAAAVYVITREDIRRAGVSTIPEALRLAPNLQVARVSSSSYAITARGFNNNSANKLLVMIDGRSVYTPLHSGVFWDAQDVMLTDIERIEVVSGPGGTLWGANAVNGVINILTRAAVDTQGTLALAEAGNRDMGVAVRHGLQLGDDVSLRLHAQSQRFDNTVRESGAAATDEWRRKAIGFRADASRSGDTMTLQGDAYDGSLQSASTADSAISGANLLARWHRPLADGASFRVQAYIDQYKRDMPALFSQRLKTYDVDVQHHFTPWQGHEVVLGGGVREQRDRTTGGALLAFVPANSTLRLVNVFAQDTVQLSDRLKLTAGAKLERNTYTGWEFQPSLRLARNTGEQDLLWTAISRAVRTPSRLDRDFQVFVNLAPPYNGMLLGGPAFRSERLTAYEIGYRSQPTPKASFSVSAYYNRYDRLRSVEPAGGDNFVLGNGVAGRAYGFELWGKYQVHERWRLSAGYNRLDLKLRFEPGSADPGNAGAGGNDPDYQFSVRSSLDLPYGMSLDVGLRAIGALPNPPVPSYVALDARLAWVLARGVEFSLAGFNLTDSRHPEFGTPGTRSELGRRVVARLVWAL